jgi:hypothetical protein
MKIRPNGRRVDNRQGQLSCGAEPWFNGRCHCQSLVLVSLENGLDGYAVLGSIEFDARLYSFATPSPQLHRKVLPAFHRRYFGGSPDLHRKTAVVAILILIGLLFALAKLRLLNLDVS